MRGLKWFDRRLSSLITPAIMPTPRPTPTYPPPPYIAPTKGNLAARDECWRAPKQASPELCVDHDLQSLASLMSETDTRRSYLDLGDPRRDSETLEGLSDAPTSPRHNDISPVLWIDEEEPIEADLPPRAHANAKITPALITISPPDRTWHSAVASWQAMNFSQTYGFDLVYVIHVHEELGHSIPLSKFQTRYHTASTGNPLVGQLLAAYGLHDMASPLHLPLHEAILQEKHLECEANTAGPDDLAYGQTYSFCRGRDYDALDLVQKDSESSQYHTRINRGIVLAAYRKDKTGPQLHEEAAEYFVDCLIDLYVWNGSHSLMLDSRTEGAECLGVTAANRESVASDI